MHLRAAALSSLLNHPPAAGGIVCHSPRHGILEEAAERQRSTSTDQIERERARAVGQAELCGEGLRLDGMTNAGGQSGNRRLYARLRIKLFVRSAPSLCTGAILTIFHCRQF